MKTNAKAMSHEQLAILTGILRRGVSLQVKYGVVRIGNWIWTAGDVPSNIEEMSGCTHAEVEAILAMVREGSLS